MWVKLVREILDSIVLANSIVLLLRGVIKETNCLYFHKRRSEFIGRIQRGVEIRLTWEFKVRTVGSNGCLMWRLFLLISCNFGITC